MDPAALIPTPDAIPVFWGWFQFFLLLTFFLHILLMNVMLGTAFIAFVSHFRRNAQTAPCTEVISGNLPFTIAFAVNFGVAPLLFVQVLYGHLIYASSILMAVFWLSIVALLAGAYALAYVYKYRYAQLGSSHLLVSGLITLLLLAIAFFFANNISLMQAPTSWTRYFDQPHGLLLSLGDPMLLPRYLHFMVSAVAVGGLAIALSFHWKQKKGDQTAGPWVTYGCRWFSYATMFNLAVGLWFLAALPKGILTTSTATGLLLLMTLGSGIVLAVPAIIFGLATRVMPAISCTLGTIALMILARSLLRTALLAPWFSVSQLPVSPAYPPLFFFLLFLVAGLALIAWMIRFVRSSCAEGEVHL
jgi:hypothetical protein